MSHFTNEPSDGEKSTPESDRSDPRRPFGNAGLDQISPPRSDDPPYRNWWVVETMDSRIYRK